MNQNGVSIDDFKHLDPKVRLQAIKNLPLISNTIGKEKTRNELLEFIVNLFEDEEEENLIEIAKIMANFLELIGGKHYFHTLLKVFESLLKLDEHNLRLETIKSLKIALSNVNINEYETNLIDMFNKLVISDDISNKISAIHLIPIIIPNVSLNNKTVLNSVFLKLSSDDNVQLRIASSLILKDLINLIDDETYMKVLIYYLKEHNDNIRVNCVNCLVAFKTNKNYLRYIDFIFSSIYSLVNDDSWRIRFSLSDNINEFFAFNPNQNIKNSLIDIFLKLLDDPEPEIRNCCFNRIEVFSSKFAKEEAFDKLLNHLRKYENETSPYVKETYASAIMKVCSFLNKNQIQDYFLPIFLNLIKDECHTTRLNALRNIESLKEVLNVDLIVNNIIPYLNEIATNKKWRIRLLVTEIFPIVSRILNKDIFLKYLLPMILNWLTDTIFAVREAGCKVIRKLYDNFKSEEFEKKIVEKNNEMRGSTNYLIRNNILLLIKEFVNDSSCQQFFENQLLPIVLKLSKDKVPNVRLTCVLILKRTVKTLKNKEFEAELRKCFEDLKRDTDFDVSTTCSEYD